MSWPLKQNSPITSRSAIEMTKAALTSCLCAHIVKQVSFMLRLSDPAQSQKQKHVAAEDHDAVLRKTALLMGIDTGCELYRDRVEIWIAAYQC